MATQIARIGKTVAVEIPEDLLRQANLEVGDHVEWTLTAAGELALQARASEPVEEGYEEWFRAEVEAGIRGLDSGKGIHGDKVIEWLRSWGTANELPPPQ
jgi:antitoxin component of MazEF toxin-antitoxin module